MAFFKLGIMDRFQVANECGLLTDADRDLDGQERWAIAFQRAEARGVLSALETAVLRRTNT